MMMSVKDYSRAISLWGGGQGEVISLLFRGMRTRGDRQKERERERVREREREKRFFSNVFIQTCAFLSGVRFF
jgi:hypothetical protein